MNSSNDKLNKQISKHYVEHACEISSTGQVAKELNLETSRVSELKGGRRQLTIEQAEILKQIYGLPSASQGHWIECELLPKDFHKSFIDNGLTIHFINLIELLNTDRFMDTFLKGVSVTASSVPGYEDPWTLKCEAREHLISSNNKILKDHKLKLLNELFERDDFQEWCESAIYLMHQSKIVKDTKFYENIFHEKDILSVIAENGVVHWNVPTSDFKRLPMICDEVEPHFRISGGYEINSRHIEKIIILYRLKQLIEGKTYANLFENEGYLFDQKIKINHKNSPVKEYVVVGKCVWNPDKLFRLQVPMIINSVVGWSPVEDDSHSYERNIMPNKHRFMFIRLFYTETYNYLVELKLFDDEYGAICNRCLMIQVEDRQNVFNELKGIFDYFKIEDTLMMNSVKRAVADNGGYIPSAIYID
ncbi:hypothetical protein ACRN9Z_09635 [Shewanella frigidimarina]|uniref:hypothetical protein n=1 Tax=Shewanella frigidimarina TaxID=56812 RepID=UPI003D7BE597